jgi:hypothetical protein
MTPEEIADKMIQVRQSGHFAIDDGHPEGAHLWEMDTDLGLHIRDMFRRAVAKMLKRELKRARVDTMREMAELVVKRFRSQEAFEVGAWLEQRANALARTARPSPVAVNTGSENGLSDSPT